MSRWKIRLAYWMAQCPSQSVLTGIVVGGAFISAFYYFYSTSRALGFVKAKPKGAVPAMANLGNTCYANSLLQGLASSSVFTKWILQVDTRSLSESNCPKFLCALKETISKLNDSSTICCSAADVIKSLLEHRWSIPANSEQDLFELFNVFVTTWEEEFATLRSARTFSLNSKLNIMDDEARPLRLEIGSVVTKSLLYTERSYCDFDGDDTKPSGNHFCRSKRFASREKELRPPCFGLLFSHLQCCQKECKYKKVRVDKFCVLSLGLPKSLAGVAVTLDTLLRRFFTPELIQGAKCDRCIKMGNNFSTGLIKKQGFCKLPSSLILRVERVGYLPSGDLYKQTDHFTFPEILDVREFCFYNDPTGLCNTVNSGAETSNSSKGVPIFSLGSNGTTGVGILESVLNQCMSEDHRRMKYKYQLQAVSVHSGQPNSGHFITYRRGIGKEYQNAWYKTSDLQVNRVPYSEVSASEAYLLYYDRIITLRRQQDLEISSCLT